MFEGLDQVNWRKIRHSYGSAENIPGLLNFVAEITDDSIADDVFSEFQNIVNHQGDIGSASAAVVPFLIQLLTQKTYRYRSQVLSCLVDLQESCDLHMLKPLRELQDETATFVSIERGIPVYLSLLTNFDNLIRGQAAYLLAQTNTGRPGVRLRLWRASEHETTPYIRAIMVYGVGTLMEEPPRRFWHVKMREQYRTEIEKLTGSTEVPIVRAAAALAWIKIASYPVPAVIPRTLGDTLALHVNDLPTNFRGPFFASSLIEQIKAAGRFDALGESLHAENMTPEAAHLIIREMLDTVFARTGRAENWRAYMPVVSLKDSKEYIYAFNENRGYRNPFSVGTSLNGWQRPALKAIVNCNVFWQLPTNLFSFFYGLPDSRDELRALLG